MTEEYIHGFSQEEQRRLTRMQELLNEEQLRAMDFTGVRSLLDVGCGLGQLTRAFARALGRGSKVVGIEREPLQRDEAARQATAAGETELVEFRAGDAECLPLHDGERESFDLAHARFVLEHVRDPLPIVRQMVAAVRPGGRVVLVDDDHDLFRLWPTCPEFDEAWQAYAAGYRDRGQDPWIGRRLASLLHDAGAVPSRVTSVFYGAVRGQERFEAVVDNLVGVFEGAAVALDRSGRLPLATTQRALTALDAWRRGAAAAVWYSIPLAEGVKR